VITVKNYEREWMTWLYVKNDEMQKMKVAYYKYALIIAVDAELLRLQDYTFDV